MKHKKILIISFVIALIVVSYTLLWPLFKDANYGKVIDYGVSGKIVDEQTGEGLEDTYVILIYRANVGHSHGGACYGDIVKTDIDGKYIIKKPTVEFRELGVWREFYFYKDKYLHRGNKYKVFSETKLTKIESDEQYLEGLYEGLQQNFCAHPEEILQKYESLYNAVEKDMEHYNNIRKNKIIDDIKYQRIIFERHYELKK